jgi:hypothetical protein
VLDRGSNELKLLEIARLLLRFDHVACFIGNAKLPSAYPRAIALRAGGSFGEGGSARSPVKLFCHARQNFPKERVKARNEFSKREFTESQNKKEK